MITVLSFLLVMAVLMAVLLSTYVKDARVAHDNGTPLRPSPALFLTTPRA